MTYEQAAIQVLKECNKTEVWFGEPDVWHDIYDLKYKNKKKHKRAHPMNVWKYVSSALYKSDKFYVRYTRRTISWSGLREYSHNVYELKEQEK